MHRREQWLSLLILGTGTLEGGLACHELRRVITAIWEQSNSLRKRRIVSDDLRWRIRKALPPQIPVGGKRDRGEH